METLRSPRSAGRNEQRSPLEEEDNYRFTLADYEYDRDDEPGSSEGIAGSSGNTGSRTISRPTVGTEYAYPQPTYGGSTQSDKDLDKGKGKSSVRQRPFIPALPAPTRPTGPLRLHSHDDTTPPRVLERQLAPQPRLEIDTALSPTRSQIDATLPSSTTIRPLPSLPQSLDSPSPPEDDAKEVDVGVGVGNGVGVGVEVCAAEKGGAVHYLDQSPPGARDREERSRIWWTKIIPSSVACRLLLLTVILESLIDLSIESNILWRFNQELESADTDLVVENSRRLPVYLVIFGLAHLWQLVLTCVAVRTKNTVQVIAVTIFNFAFLGYAVIEIYELRTILGDNLSTSLTGDSTTTSLLTLPLNVLTAVIIAVVAICCVILVILTLILRREFGWRRYRFLGADLQIRKYYLRFQVFECICYFSAFFCAGFGIQFIWLVLQKTDVEYIITWIMFPVSILLLVVGRFAAKYENRPFMAFFTFGLILGIAYFLFKIVRIWQQSTTTYASVSKSLTVFDILSVLSLVGCLVWGAMVWSDFGKGLKEAVLSNPNGSITARLGMGLWRTGSTPSEPAESEMSVVQKRLSID